MAVAAEQVEAIYSGSMVDRYDRSTGHFFGRMKRRALVDAQLQPGNRVLVFCCGTGADFPPIVEQVGPTGSVVGVDSSAAMLARAQHRVDTMGWTNVQLALADVTQPQPGWRGAFDVGVCTLGLSIIPNHLAAFHHLVDCVKEGGRVVVGDMQLASGWRAVFNPLTVAMSRRFGGSDAGHANSRAIADAMARKLVSATKREYMLGAYYHCTATVPPSHARAQNAGHRPATFSV